MQFSVCNRSIFEIFVFCEKCKQTAEISWLLFWDVKISKKVINKNFVIFYRDVKTYLDLCSPCTQFEIAHFSEILFLLFAVKLKWKKFLWKIQLILLLWCPFCFASTGLVIWPSGSLPKFGKITKPVENLKNFLVTLTETLVCWLIVL